MTAMVDTAIEELTAVVGVRRACAAVGVAQADWYRRHRQTPAPPKPQRPRRPQPRALTADERAEVREVLNSPEHVDEAPATVYAKLLDEGRYLASERTMYRILEFPDRFGSFTHAAQHCETFFDWYNLEHRHSGIGLHTPFDVHHGHAHAVREKRQIVLDGAYQLHPERFVKRPPSPPPLPDAVWINKPNKEEPTTH